MREKDPIPTFSYLIQQLHDRFPDLAYLHLVEPRIKGDNDAKEADASQEDSNDFARTIWGERPLIVAGGFNPKTAANKVEKDGGLVAFGRWYISNVSVSLQVQTLSDTLPSSLICPNGSRLEQTLHHMIAHFSTRSKVRMATSIIHS
jgi:2,4-dienoyl-CoA reductase-like NADH-dependent reductase (Old Yellow Enzyme family)